MAQIPLHESKNQTKTPAGMLIERETLERDEVERFLSDIAKRPQRDLTVRGAGLAVSRRAIRTQREQRQSPGTIPPNPVG